MTYKKKALTRFTPQEVPSQGHLQTIRAIFLKAQEGFGGKNQSTHLGTGDLPHVFFW